MSQFTFYLGVLVSLMGAATAAIAQESDTVVVRFQDTGEIFQANPGKGFMTFQRFNGDTANVLQECCGDFREDFPFPVLKDSEGALYNEDYPNTSIAYFRF